MIVKAFTVQETHDEFYTYWIVPLHDFRLGDQQKMVFELFHSQEDAERFAAEHRNKQNQ
jgi:hypothetical protein